MPIFDKWVQSKYNLDMFEDEIDWTLLESEYIIGSVKSVRKFMELNGKQMNGGVARRTKGWRKKREKYHQKLEDATQDKLIEMESETEAQIRERHMRAARMLQLKGLAALEKFSIDNQNQAIKAIEIGLKSEREAAGIVNTQKIDSNSIVDFQNLPIMKTRYGKKIMEMNNEELIAVLKRLQELEDADKK